MMHLMKSAWLFAAGIASMVIAFTGIAQAEEGTVKATAAWESQGYAFPVGEDQAYMVAVYTGVMFVDGGKGALEAASVVCPGTLDANLAKGTKTGEGRCTITDVDGDRVFARYSCSGDILESCRGPFTIVSGTGMFAGITGGGEMISRVQARQFTAFAGMENVHQQGIGAAVWPALQYKIPNKPK